MLRITDIQNDRVDWNKVPFCKINNDDIEKYRLKNGDIVFARTGATVGKSFLINGSIPDSVFASYLIRIILYHRLLSKYVYYFFKTSNYWKQISQSSAGIGQPNVNATKLSNIEIPLPPLPEQHRIVAKIEELFTKLDAGVNALQKAKALLKQYRQSVLKAAVEGRLTEEWREEHAGEIEPASELLERIQTKRKARLGSKYKPPKPVDTTNLPEIPDSWVWTRVGEIAHQIQYGFTEKATSEKVGPKFLRITDIQNRTVNWGDVPYCKINEQDKPNYLLESGDLVFARTGATVGKSYLIGENIPEAIFASYLIRVKIHFEVSKRYIYNFFQCHLYWKQISQNQLGIGQPNVNGNSLANILLPLSPLAEQQQIVLEVERRLSVADEMEKTIETVLKQAQSLQQSILKRAFEGKLVPQDPADPPARELLERIKAGKSTT